jgi:hypothetical protein
MNEGLLDELTLGQIAWYTITKPRVTAKDVKQLAGTLGLAKSIVPSAPRPGDAFKRACRYSERLGADIPGTPNKANFLIRKVATTLEDIERHIVLEIVDPKGRKLSHEDVAHMRFDRTDGILHLDTQGLHGELAEMLDDVLTMFKMNLLDATKYIDAQVIRRMIRDQLDLVSAIALRRQGSVYFVPQEHVDKVKALEEFCRHMGPGSEFISIPMPAGDKYNVMVKAAFEAEIHEESTQHITKLKELTESGGTISSRGFERYRKRLDELKRRADSYSGLVEVEIFKAHAELKALEQHLGKVLTGGHIK